ncbi:carboxylesterase notum2 isoform X1 [Alosa sapidissima]|uniref:carboxylesterase notum2 isoform X1 n=1 Tax=Alosa sapidissima TaxID=34773 RepID=UPI001C092D66|nr:carboxylesterase notum2 isoform X1 [Alosa sapidissima]
MAGQTCYLFSPASGVQPQCVISLSPDLAPAQRRCWETASIWCHYKDRSAPPPQPKVHTNRLTAHCPHTSQQTAGWLTVSQGCISQGGPAEFAMKILYHVIFLLLLGGISCQNKNNAKPSGKSSKRAGSQAGDGAHDDDAADGGREPGAGGRGSSHQTTSSSKAADEMKLHFLKNTQVTCNDGTAAGFYLKEFKGSKRWLIFLEGGWCCYNKDTCDSRYKNTPRLMSSTDWPQTRKGTGILSPQTEENPHWYNANIVFIPYCTSDVWSGSKTTKPKEKGKDSVDYTFMGSLVIREVIKDLTTKGIKQAKVVMLAGTSAGGTGVLLNIEKVSSQLEQLGGEAQVRGLVDSGWFLEGRQQKVLECSDGVSCSPVDAIKKGLRLWSGNIPEKCRQQYKRGEEWQCFFGHKVYSSLTPPLFVVQWLFDEEQLRVENIYIGGQTLSDQQWTYMQNLGRELKNSLKDVTAVFAPSCLSHTLITKSNWMDFQVKGTSLSRALQCWDKSLQEANKNSKTPVKGCPFHLIDNCHWPQCNPTCPALIDQASQQELTLLQVLASMGLDLQKLGLDPRRDGHAISIVGSGG